MVRFAVIGTNFITDRLLAAAALCPDFKLQAVYSRTMERAQAYAHAHGAPLCFSSLEELAACPEVDAIYLASPNALHKAQALLLLRSGKHVLCEKPAATNAAELRELLHAAQESGTVFLEAMRPVFSPGFALMKQSLHRLGAIRRVTLGYCQYSSRYDKFKAGTVENAFNPTLSNSALMDIGVYCVHTLVALFGKPESLLASSVLLENGFEGLGSITAHYPGMLAELRYSKITDSHLPSEIQGEGGCLGIGQISTPQELEIRWRGGSREALPVEQQPHDMLYELEEFLRCTAAPQRAQQYNHWSLLAAEMMDEARRQTGMVFPADATGHAAHQPQDTK